MTDRYTNSSPSPTVLHLDEVYMNHVAPPGHPERPERIGRLLDGRDRFVQLGAVPVDTGRAATRDELLLVHTPDHVTRVAATAGKRVAHLDPDTYTSELSYDTALRAVGGLLDVVDVVVAGDSRRGIALIRPPGHHAEDARAMGFCLFNNVAVAARYLQRYHGLERVLIVDWDVHHGNGTQQIFYGDDTVLYASLHQYPLYPGTGAAREVGAGGGEGYTVNVPVPPGSGDDEFMAATRSVVIPIAEQFKPQFVLISAGFDAHKNDPLAALRVTEAGYAAVTSALLEMADRHADGRVVAVLEGGYDLDTLASCVEQLVQTMRGLESPELALADGTAADVLSPVLKIQSDYWNL
jgi:acetoin utilization deacetylase AcuC-like enzyme